MNPSLLLLHSLAALIGPQGPPQDPQQAQARVPMPVPHAVVCRRGDHNIEVDGSLLDWPDLPPIILDDPRQLSGTADGAWRGPKDLSATAFMLWDEKFLYFAAVVHDEWHRPLGQQVQPMEIPAVDAVVLTFDPQRDTRSLGPDPGRAEDREYWLADDESHALLQWDRLRGEARQLDDGRQFVAHDKVLGLTTYEARIPWHDILPVGKTPAEGLAFDMQIVINDYDESTDPMPQTRIGWTFGCGPLVDPGLLGTVMLVGDSKSIGDRWPDFPERRALGRDPVPPPKHWQEFAAALAKAPPAVHDGSKSPAEAGGTARLKLLEELDDHCERFPRIDWLEYHFRISRRMQREVGGIAATGLPYYWLEETKRLSERAEAMPANGRARLFRLPMGGWLVRSQTRNFAIDPAGPDLARYLWGGMEFALITQPLDLTRRSDQLLIRMAADKPPRPFLTHIVFHLPLVSMNDIQPVTPGKSYGQSNGMEVRALGKPEADGRVQAAIGYRVAMPNSVSLLVAGPQFRLQDLPEEPSSAVLLSPRNPDAAAIAHAAKTDLIVIDDSFLPQTFPGIRRVRLQDLHDLQKAVLPKPSVLLGPGESWDIGGK